MNASPSNKPIPTRFREREVVFLLELQSRTGLSISELIRRSVRLLILEMQRPDADSLILHLVA